MALATPRELKPEILRAVLTQMSDGIPLRQICRDNPDLPQPGTITQWIEEQGGAWIGRYARARENCYDMMAEECLEIVDACTTAEEATIARERVNMRKWLLSKVAPRYADVPTMVINAAAIQVVAPHQAISSGSSRMLEIGSGDTGDSDTE